MASLSHTQPNGVHTTHCARSYDIRFRVVSSLHIAITFIRHTVQVHTTLRLGAVRIVHVAIRDGVHKIPRRSVVRTVHVAKPDAVHTTHCARASRRVAKHDCFLTILRTFIRHTTSRIQMTFRRHYALSQKKMASISH